MEKFDNEITANTRYNELKDKNDWVVLYQKGEEFFIEVHNELKVLKEFKKKP